MLNYGNSKAFQKPNYKFWAKNDLWTLTQAILLTMDIDPSESDRFFPGGYDQRDATKEATAEFSSRYDLAESSILVGKLKPQRATSDGVGGKIYHLDPADFLEWAKTKDISFPPALASAMVTNESTISKLPAEVSSEDGLLVTAKQLAQIFPQGEAASSLKWWRTQIRKAKENGLSAARRMKAKGTAQSMFNMVAIGEWIVETKKSRSRDWVNAQLKKNVPDHLKHFYD